LNTVQSASLRIDVAHHTPFRGSIETAAWLFAPPHGERIKPELLVCLHGATCDHRYFHAEFTHHSGYSFAEYITGLGYYVLAIDHPGMGSSVRPEPERLLTRDVVAAANDHIVREVVQGLASGRWFGHPPRPALQVTGLAHSLGGMLGIAQQARHRTFARMAVLGWSNIGVRFEGEEARGMSEAAARDGYLPAPRALTRALFHLADVPVDLIDEDDLRASLTPANLGRAAMTPGIVAREAAQIECPLLLLYGEVDTSPDPHAEVEFYRACRDITLVVLRGSAHMHNYASTRRDGWRRIGQWLES
jgi:pimeloyl-ACP methyl ester carboxylesterase